MSEAKKAQNLARIRDNQRRSRARRKEYLHELEAKLRSCEQRGIEASAEIQSAARRVLEENKKLRALLRERGVPETEVISVLGTSESSFEHASAAPILNTMLDRRWACEASSYTPSPSSPESSYGDAAPSSASVAPISIPTQRTVALSSSEAYSPHSMVSSIETPPNYRGTPFYQPPEASAPEVKAEDIPPFNYHYDQPLPESWTFSQDGSFTSDPSNYYNTTSCANATTIIRGMRMDAGPEIEAGFGCRIPTSDCYVDDSVPIVFNMMDKYSTQRVSV
ncbi:hypothetical protein P154DRAFT_527606 [Amniculicola lignicola CBS 123094]|uniref:BZIP domain-containing protein n=1 Tax=Amniculicola lignicola CBS 123094 TaxID=1392246 RepID=A0A6A5VYD0_9PLEO|nr:hypothetical protein P154DRAFT_527606 [Amniculicola lignicola CBS 123094]